MHCKNLEILRNAVQKTWQIIHNIKQKSDAKTTQWNTNCNARHLQRKDVCNDTQTTIEQRLPRSHTYAQMPQKKGSCAKTWWAVGSWTQHAVAFSPERLTYMYVYTETYVSGLDIIFVRLNISIYIYIYIYLCICTWMHTCISVEVDIHIYIYIYIFVIYAWMDLQKWWWGQDVCDSDDYGGDSK